jgi:hypothetical protein
MSKHYELTIDLATLEHLGIGLYSNIPAVLSEAVANAWDADAHNVDINIDTAKGIVTVQDDGWGMSEADINARFLRVGYRKREDVHARIPEGRKPMGRKGIGKLALFSVANTIEVHSVQKDDNGRIIERNGFIMRVSDITQCINQGRRNYEPEVVSEDKVTIEQGTLITLRELRSSTRVADPYLRTRLARRFSVFGKKTNFIVRVGDKEITVADRDYFGRLEYIWCIGPDGEQYLEHCRKVRRSEKLDGTVDAAGGYEARGWVGTMEEHKSVEEGNNGIVILARGKVIHENILPAVKEGRVFSKYIVGELSAEFLDIDGMDDIATSNRQSVMEADPRFESLKKFVKDKVLNRIGNVWTDWRNEDKSEEALENPAIKRWFEGLSKGHRRFAKSLLGKIASFPTADDDFRRTLYRHGILAFETLAAADRLDALDKLEPDEHLHNLLELLHDIDDLEAVHYWQITRTRVDVLRKFEKIAVSEKEKVLQKYIFEHLWLLDPSWERASTDKRMEASVTAEWKKLDARLTTPEKRGRIDIRYRTAAGKHIIIELKKYDRKVEATELAKQVRLYKTALEKCLKKAFPLRENHDIEAICIVGSPPEGRDSENRETLRAVGARYITYDQLIRQTRESYADYLKTSEKISHIQQLVSKI